MAVQTRGSSEKADNPTEVEEPVPNRAARRAAQKKESKVTKVTKTTTTKKSRSSTRSGPSKTLNPKTTKYE